MADETPTSLDAVTPDAPDATKPSRRKQAVPDGPATTGPAAPDAPEPVWLRYVGQVKRAFVHLGGEIEPGQVVRVAHRRIAELLAAMGDFEHADEPPAPADTATITH